MSVDRDVTVIARMFAQPARAAMCLALMEDRALTATELAQIAGVGKSTASEHLHALVDSGLVTVQRQGRHTYHRLAGQDVAEVLEGLARLAPPVAVRSLRQAQSAASLAMARTCYDHLAGRLGVQLYDRMRGTGALTLERGALSVEAAHPLYRALGIDLAALQRQRRVLIRECLDWTERRPHLAGLLAAELLTSMRTAGWLASARRPREITLTRTGHRELSGLDLIETGTDAVTVN